MDLGLKGKRVLITGASKGIGAEISRQFASEGCRISLIARNEENLRTVLNEIGGTKVGHTYLNLDLRAPGASTRAAQKLLAQHAEIDIVVHNVGGGLGVKDPIADIGDWLKVWQFNVGVVIEMNRLIVPHLKKKQWGRIIHISSINALTGGTMLEPYGGSPAYSCAKAYLNMYTKIIGRELARDNIIVSAVMPGAILSEGKHWEKLIEKNPELVNEYLLRYHAIGRFGNAEEIAPFVLLLASKHASFAPGSVFPIDGGIL
jgi:3-oxoacyl-[acyl-carrier protein] reductase